MTAARRFARPGRLAAELPFWDDSALGSHTVTPMQTRAWNVACAETFLRDVNLSVIVIEDATGPTAIAPLVRTPSFPPVRELLGVRELSEPSDFIFRGPEALEALMRELSRESTPLLLQRVQADSPSVEALRRTFRRRGVVISRPGNNCPHIQLQTGGKQPDDLLSSRLRSDLRRAQRKAEFQGNVSYEIHAPRSAAEFVPLYKQALQIEAAGWKGRGGSAIAADELLRAFFGRYGVLASEAGILRLAFLRLDGVLAAMQYAVQWNGAFWLLKIGHDERFSKCSPGMLLMHHTLRYASDQGLGSYEFLGVAETWTQRWTTAERSTLRVTVYPFGPTGMLTLGRDLFRSLRQKVAARMEGRRQPSQAHVVGDVPPRTEAQGE